MQHVHKRFGATYALRDVSLEVNAGEVLALIGENGAGKSTLMKTLSGAHAPDSGRMELNGVSFAPANPQQARMAGVAMIYQELNLAPDLSVEDNIMLGQERHCLGLLNRNSQRTRVREVLQLLGHGDLSLTAPVRSLSMGTQQVVEIARALISQARIIVFDEPTSSLTQSDSQRLFDVIRKLKHSGLGVIYISHFLEEIRKICDRYTVLRDGQIAGNGTIASATDANIVTLMVGRNMDELFPCVPHVPGEILLSLQELSGRRMPENVTLSLRRGEILGIAGLVGAGRTELLRCLFSLDPVRSGQVRIAAISPSAKPRARIRAGLGFVSEDRKGEGLAQSRSIADNMTYSRLAPYTRAGWLQLRKRKAAVRDWMLRMKIKAHSPEQEVVQLSGGNQQKVALARVLHQQADVLLLDEPTRGIDVGTKAEIYRLMGELAVEGNAILFVSSYMPELLAVCDRVAVMSRGKLREIRAAGDWTEETLLSAAIGSGENAG